MATISDLPPSLVDEMSDVELLCHAIHICGEDRLKNDEHSVLKQITFQTLARVNKLLNQKYKIGGYYIIIG